MCRLQNGGHFVQGKMSKKAGSGWESTGSDTGRGVIEWVGVVWGQVGEEIIQCTARQEVTKPISAVRLFFLFSTIVKTQDAYWISNWYLMAELWWQLSNMKTISRTYPVFVQNKKTSLIESAGGTEHTCLSVGWLGQISLDKMYTNPIVICIWHHGFPQLPVLHHVQMVRDLP